MDDELNGRQPQLKTTSINDDYNGRQHNGRRPQLKTTSVEGYLSERQPQ